MSSRFAHAQRVAVSLVVGQRPARDSRRWVRVGSGLGPPWVRVSNAVVTGWVQGAGLPRARTPARARTRAEHPSPSHPPYVRVVTRTTRTQCRLARNDGKKWVQVHPDPMPIQSDPGRTRNQRVLPALPMHAGKHGRGISLAAAVSVWVHGFGSIAVNAVGDLA